MTVTVPGRAAVIAAGLARPPVLVTVSGAHRYGFASVDSDLDLRGAFRPATVRRRPGVPHRVARPRKLV